MKEILTKIQEILDKITIEKKFGNIVFLGLIERGDQNNKWDIVVSANSITENNSQKDLIYLIDLITQQFENDFSFLSQIVTLKPTEDFIVRLGAALRERGKESGEITDLVLSNNINLGRLFVFAADFTGIDLSSITKQGVYDTPSEIKGF